MWRKIVSIDDSYLWITINDESGCQFPITPKALQITLIIQSQRHEEKFITEAIGVDSMECHKATRTETEEILVSMS